MEPDVKDLIAMHDDGTHAVGIFKGGIVQIGHGPTEESFYLPAAAIYSMFKYWNAAGFKLEPPSQEALDAQRYRYLRNRAGVGDDFDGPMVCDGLGDQFDYLRGADVDEAVDAAMLAERGTSPPEGKE